MHLYLISRQYVLCLASYFSLPPSRERWKGNTILKTSFATTFQMKSIQICCSLHYQALFLFSWWLLFAFEG